MGARSGGGGGGRGGGALAPLSPLQSKVKDRIGRVLNDQAAEKTIRKYWNSKYGTKITAPSKIAADIMDSYRADRINGWD